MATWTTPDLRGLKAVRKDLETRFAHKPTERQPDSIMEPAARGRMAKRMRVAKPTAVHPLGDGTYLMSDDPRLFLIKQELLVAYRELHKQTVVLESGICLAPAVTSDASGLLTVSGIPMTPFLQPPLDNESIRDDLKLKKAFSNKRHAVLFDRLCHMAFSVAKPHSTNINKLASSGPPLAIKDPIVKAMYVLKVMDHLPRVLQLFKDGDFTTLWREFDITVAHLHGERRSADSAEIKWQGDKIVAVHGKERIVSVVKEDGSYMLTTADKTMPRESGINFPAVGERGRVVWGTGAAMNLVHTAFWTPLLHGLTSLMPFGLHHTGFVNFADKINASGNLIGLDMSQFDSTVPFDVSNRFFNNLSEHFDPQFVDTMRLMHHAPFWSASPMRDVQDAKWYGNPFDPVRTAMNYGLPSGVAHNTYMGKIVGFWHCLCCFDDIRAIDQGYASIDAAILAIGRGTHKLAKYMGSGDDTVAGSPDDSYAHDFRAYVAAGGPQIVKLDVEQVIKFLGMVPYKYTESETLCQVCADLPSKDIKWLAPERGLDDRLYRQYAVDVGWFARNRLYASCPGYSVVHSVLNDSFVRHIGHSADELIKMEIARKGTQLTNIAGYSEADLLYIDKPARIHYLLDPDTIRPELREQAMTSLPPEVGMRLIMQTKKKDSLYTLSIKTRTGWTSALQYMTENPIIRKKTDWIVMMINVIRKMNFTMELSARMMRNKKNKELDDKAKEGTLATIGPNQSDVRSLGGQISDYVGRKIDILGSLMSRGQVKQYSPRRKHNDEERN